MVIAVVKMKNIIIYLVIVLLAIIGAAAICDDIDSGRDYYVLGSVAGIDGFGSDYEFFEYCIKFYSITFCTGIFYKFDNRIRSSFVRIIGLKYYWNDNPSRNYISHI